MPWRMSDRSVASLVASLCLAGCTLLHEGRHLVAAERRSRSDVVGQPDFLVAGVTGLACGGSNKVLVSWLPRDIPRRPLSGKSLSSPRCRMHRIAARNDGCSVMFDAGQCVPDCRMG